MDFATSVVECKVCLYAFFLSVRLSMNERKSCKVVNNISTLFIQAFSF